GSFAGVEYAGDIRMVHQCQGLPLGLEAGDDLAGIHAMLDDFEGDAALDGLTLLGHEDDSEATFADLLEGSVTADGGDGRGAGGWGGRSDRRRTIERGTDRGGYGRRWLNGRVGFRGPGG